MRHKLSYCIGVPDMPSLCVIPAMGIAHGETDGISILTRKKQKT
jgi:hypothetical protein